MTNFASRRRQLRALSILALAAALVLSLAGVSAAGPVRDDSGSFRPTVAVADAGTAPPGWSLRTGPDGARLEWRSDRAIPIGDAAVEFWWDQVLLGTPQPLADGKTFRLEVESLPGTDLGALRVTRGGVPLGRDGLAARRAPAVATSGAELRREWQRQQLLSQDPGRPGPFDTTSSSYQLAQVPYREYAEPLDIVGRVVRPVAAAGPRPLVVFLHGRHGTCYKGKRSTGDWPCRSGWEPIPSYLGYLSMQRLLASQGYITVSIDANAINGQDWQSPDGGAAARSALVRKHLQAWNTWSTVGAAPFGSDLVGAVDMSRVVLVGHSRGGEGVNRAAVDSRRGTGWQIAGQVLIGPTAFGRQIKPGLPTVALLPFCDGDVSDLQGQQYIDMSRDILDDTDQALRSSVMVMGANHNYFNAEWTPGVSQAPSFDDWGDRGDSQCGVGSGSASLPCRTARCRWHLRGCRDSPLCGSRSVGASAAGR